MYQAVECPKQPVPVTQGSGGRLLITISPSPTIRGFPPRVPVHMIYTDGISQQQLAILPASLPIHSFALLTANITIIRVYATGGGMASSCTFTIQLPGKCASLLYIRYSVTR